MCFYMQGEPVQDSSPSPCSSPALALSDDLNVPCWIWSTADTIFYIHIHRHRKYLLRYLWRLFSSRFSHMHLSPVSSLPLKRLFMTFVVELMPYRVGSLMGFWGWYEWLKSMYVFTSWCNFSVVVPETDMLELSNSWRFFKDIFSKSLFFIFIVFI